jgi:hypothetical protein
MSEHLQDLIAKVQVKFNLTTDSRLLPVLQELGLEVAKSCVDVCEQRVKARDVEGNEYVVVKNHSQELCVKAIRGQFKL